MREGKPGAWWMNVPSAGLAFRQIYGVWLKEWHQLARAAFVIDRQDCITLVEYIADQNRGPDYEAAG